MAACSDTSQSLTLQPTQPFWLLPDGTRGSSRPPTPRCCGCADPGPAQLDLSKHADDAWYFANARNAASIELHAPFGFEEVTRSFFYPRVDFDRGEGILFRRRFPSA
jgi:hypothetical protein